MKKYTMFLILSLWSIGILAQFQIGLDGGTYIPVEEEFGSYKPTIGLKLNTYYIDKNNVTFGAHVTFLKKMNLNENWATDKFGYETVMYNTAYKKYNPILGLSIHYLLKNNSKPISTYFGLNGSYYSYSANGAIKVGSSGNSLELEFYGEEHSNLGLAPKFGLIYNITEKMKVNGELKYDMIDFEFIHHLLSINIGLVYSFKRKD